MGGTFNFTRQQKFVPWQLLKRYVAFTAKHILPGATVFRALTPPFRPLKANSIGSITKDALQKLGINTSVWKPHSTRGAGVTMYKKMGLNSEQVCEIGKWKNVGAFTSHYLRLGATNVASAKLSQLVHTVSPLGVAESDLTWTPGKHDTGGSVREDEARSNGETRFWLAGGLCFFCCFSCWGPVAVCIAFFAGDWRSASRVKNSSHRQASQDKNPKETRKKRS